MNTFIPLVFILIAVGVGNVYKFSLFSSEVHISVLDCIVFLLTAYQLLRFRKNYLTVLKNNRDVVRPLSLFFIVGATALIVAGYHYGGVAQVVGSMYLVRWIVYSLFFSTILQLMKRQHIGIGLVAMTTILAVTGIAQYLFFPDVRAFAVFDWDPHYYRVVGTLLDPGFVGILLVMGMVFLLDHKTKFHKVLLIFTYLAFALTYSRSSYLAFTVAVIYLAWQGRGWKFLSKALLLLAITLVALPRYSGGEGVRLERTNSIEARITNWKNSLTIFADHPVLGVGFNTYRYAQKEYGFLAQNSWLSSHAGAGADSSLLFVSATTGIVGLTAYLWYLSRLWIRPGLRVYMLALVVHSWFLNSLFYPFVLVYLAFLTGYMRRSIPSGSGSQPGQPQ